MLTTAFCALLVGMVPALFDDAEKDALLSGIREARTAAGLPDHKEACWAAFVDECRNNLHVVLAMSPVGETLRTRCRNFPGMVNNTVIDWFEPWPEQVSSQAERIQQRGVAELLSATIVQCHVTIAARSLISVHICSMCASTC